MFYNKPLEQFTIKTFFKQKLILKTYFFIDFMDLMLFINIILTFIIGLNNRIFIIQKRTFQFLQPILHQFLRNMLIGQLSYSGEIYFFAIITFFFVILTFNLLGMVPSFFCVTSQLGVALSLSFSIFFGAVYFIFNNCGLIYFIHLFIPHGVPKVLLPLLFILEIISFLSRALSLAIRLFANMVAGHSLLHILAGSLVNVGNSLKKIDNFFFFIILIPFIVILLVYFLELGIAFLQAYVFIMLSLIYLKDTLVYVEVSDKRNFLTTGFDSINNLFTTIKSYGKNLK
jgi:ATP synthase subunit 6